MKYEGVMEKEERMMAIQKGDEINKRYHTLIEQKRELQKQLEDLTSTLTMVRETRSQFMAIYGLDIKNGTVVLVEEVEDDPYW